MSFFSKLFGFDSKPKVGDIVICVDDRNWNNQYTNIQLAYNQKYKLYGITTCHGSYYDINAKLIPNTLFTSCSCEKPMTGIGVHWACASRFRKATYLEVLDYQIDLLNVELNDAIETEDYSKASKLQKKIGKLNKLKTKKSI